MKVASIILTIVAGIAGIIFIVLPLATLFGGNWPLAIIGEAKWDLSRWWTANSRLIIIGIVLFFVLYTPALVLKDKIKKREVGQTREDTTQEKPE